MPKTFKFSRREQTDDLRLEYILISKKTKQILPMILLGLVIFIVFLLSIIIKYFFPKLDFLSIFIILYVLFSITLILYQANIDYKRNKRILAIKIDDIDWYLQTQTDDEMYLFKKVLHKNISDSTGELKLLKTEKLVEYYNGFIDKNEIVTNE